MRNAYVECRIILIDPPRSVAETAADTAIAHANRIEAANATALSRLSQAFGGYTMTSGKGGWIAPDGTLHNDDVLVVDVAVPMFLSVSQAGGIVTHETERAGMHATSVLFEIAREYCRDAGQQCVYVRGPHGDVALIDQHGRNISPDAVPPAYPHADHYWNARAYRAPGR